MAYNRPPGPGVPQGQGGYNMMPGAQSFIPNIPMSYSMMQQYPMSVQQMTGQRFPVQTHGPHISQAGFPVMYAQGGGIVPSFLPTASLTPEMQKNLQAQQNQMMKQQRKLIEDQRKREEQMRKDWNFQMQQQRLRALGTIGVKPAIDADRLLESMFGKKEELKPKVKEAFKPQETSIESFSSEPSCEDTFGDFIQGPSSTADIQTIAADKTLDSEIEMTPVKSIANSHPARKKDLELLMQQNIDLKHQSAAKSFQKVPMPNVPIQQSKATAYNASQKARKWDTSIEDIQQLFSSVAVEGTSPADQTFPSPTSPTNGQPLNQTPTGNLPFWLFNENQIPEFYKRVLEATSKNGIIDTDLVYPILISSGLPRETLGFIWGLANKTTPGQLTKEELYIVLACICLVQCGHQFSNTDILLQVSQPPIPMLNHPLFFPPTSTSFTSNSTNLTQSSPASPNQIILARPQFPAVPVSPVQTTMTPISSGVPFNPGVDTNISSNTSSGSASCTVINNVGICSSNTSGKSAIIHEATDSGTQPKKTFPVSSKLNHFSDDSDFQPFASAPKHPTSPDSDYTDEVPAPLPKKERSPSISSTDKYAAFRIEANYSPVSDSNSDKHSMYGGIRTTIAEEHKCHFSIGNTPIITPDTSLVLDEDFDNFKASDSATTNLDASEDNFADFQAFQSSETHHHSHSFHRHENFANFRSISEDKEVDDFADFQQANVVNNNNATPRPKPQLPLYDKYSALKKLQLEDSHKPQDDEEWQEFKGSPIPEDKPSAFRTISSSGKVDELVKESQGEYDDVPVFSTFFAQSGEDFTKKGINFAKSEQDSDFADYVQMNFTNGNIPALSQTLDNWPIESNKQSPIGKSNHGDSKPSLTKIGSDDRESVKSLELKSLNFDLGSGDDNQSINENLNPEQRSIHSHNSDPDDFSNANDVNTSRTVAFESSNVFIQNVGPLPWSDRYNAVAEDNQIPYQETDRHAYEWQRCLESCYELIKNANNVFNSASSSAVCQEVLRSEEGGEYITNIVEIYRVACCITLSIKNSAIENDKLLKVLKNIELVWNNLTAFIAGSSLMPDVGSLDFSAGLLKPDSDVAHKACGVCLLNVDSRSKAFDHEQDGHKLTYGGRQYHASCANFWVNCVDSILPALPLNELL